jgi:hypothetical protein
MMCGSLKFGSGVLTSIRMVLLGFTLLVCNPAAQAADGAGDSNGTQVLEAFDRQQVQRVNEGSAVSDHKKQVIMFAMGVPLVILLLITGGLGIAVGVYGKPLFVTHMVFAGLTMTLALVHVIVGIVWFYPF